MLDKFYISVFSDDTQKDYHVQTVDTRSKRVHSRLFDLTAHHINGSFNSECDYIIERYINGYLPGTVTFQINSDHYDSFLAQVKNILVELSDPNNKSSYYFNNNNKQRIEIILNQEKIL